MQETNQETEQAEPKWYISKLCAHCSNPKCLGYTEDEAHDKKGCMTLFWLAVGEYTLEQAIRERKKIEDRIFSTRR